MANSVHLQKLCEGPVAWNAWREANPTVMPDLANASLSLSQRQWGPSNGGPINLRGANLEGSMLRFATLTGADLEGARLVGTDLMHARLDRANLSGADLTDAMLDHTDLTGTRLEGATLVGATLQNARNLRQPQVDSAHGDASTLLPLGLVAPQRWFPAASPEEFLGCPIPEEVLEEQEEDNNPYRLLGVAPNAEPAEIREAYRKLVKQLHPDLNPGNREAEIKFRKISEAYQTLKNGPVVEEAPLRASQPPEVAHGRGRFEVAALFALFIAIGGGVFYWLETMPDEPQVASVQEEAPKPVPQLTKTIAESIPPAEADKLEKSVSTVAALPKAEERPAAIKPVAEPEEKPQPEQEQQAQVQPQPQTPAQSDLEQPAQAQPQIPARSEPKQQEATEPQTQVKAEPVTAPATPNDTTVSGQIAVLQTPPAAETPAAKPEKTTPPSVKGGGQLLSVHAEPDRVNTSSKVSPATANQAASPAPVKIAVWEEEWKRLSGSHDFGAIYSYIRRHPAEPAAAEARARFRTVLASLAHPTELAGFVKKNEGQDNQEMAAARQRLAKLIEDESLKVEAAAWDAAEKKNTRAAYEGYLRTYRNGPHAGQANEKIAALREAYRQRDAAAWAKASQDNTREAYSAYLSAHPRGYFVKDAQKKLTELQQTQNRPAKPKPPVTQPIFNFDN